MAHGVSKCPGCGEPASPFAAGCAICGTDLEAARAARRSRSLPAIPRISAPSVHADVDWVHIAVAAVLALAAPPIGLVLAIYWAVSRYRRGQTVMAVAMVGAAALAIGMLLAPMLFWNHLLKL